MATFTTGGGVTLHDTDEGDGTSVVDQPEARNAAILEFRS
jgi:hypothetical protein